MLNSKPERRLPLIVLSLACVVMRTAIANGLPPGVPNPIGPDGKYTHALFFTTKAYQDEALKLVIREANQVAKELKLSNESPITESNIVKSFINPFGYAYAKKAIGNITTSNYCYYVAQGNKFSYLESPHQDKLCRKFQVAYTLPVSEIDTNEALKLATRWLKAISMDTKALNRDCSVTVELDRAYVHPPVGKIVPLYYVCWFNNQKQGVASVRVFTPTKTLLQLRVEDSKYIRRPQFEFANLDFLLSQTNVVESGNVPSKQ